VKLSTKTLSEYSSNRPRHDEVDQRADEIEQNSRCLSE
jgi:hypothetical protein